MKRFLCLFLLLTVCLSAVGCRQPIKQAPSDAAVSAVTYLILGMDEAAANTDVMFLCHADTERQTLTFLQLPRDTYYAFGAGQEKINQLFAFHRARGETLIEAAVAVKDALKSVFAIPIDGVVALSLSAFCGVVDAIGGVEVTLPRDIPMEDGTVLSAGLHTLSGKEAETFVRYRAGYATADLGRMDAQKLFLSAFLRTVREKIGVTEACRLLYSVKDQLCGDIGISDAVSLLLCVYPICRTADVQYATLPGEATVHEGISYYVINRPATASLLEGVFGDSFGVLDETRRLTRSDDVTFEDIYTDPNVSVKRYTDETLTGLRFPLR